jgi:hypothetical protein
MVPEARLQAHHPRFPKAVDRRVRHLAEILPEEVAHAARVGGNHRKRRIVPHRADSLLGVVHHRAEDQLHVLHGVPGGNLQLAQHGALGLRRRFLGTGISASVEKSPTQSA